MRRTANVLLLILLAATIAACSSVRRDFVKEHVEALPPANDTPSTKYINAELRNHDKQSGFRLLTKSNDALMSRIALVDHAQHSIDLQYYIFKNDETGRLLAQHLLAAADRGVRVRILLDDINLSHQDRMLDALDVHEKIEVRLFNPYRTRSPSMASKIGQFLIEGPRLNRRMHNKSFIADNTAAVIGGRNIGNDYFDAGRDTNFRDLDLIAIGPVVQQASAIFDEYWNCDAAFPVKALSNPKDPKGDLERLRSSLARDARKFEQSDYAMNVLEELPEGATGDRWGSWFWGNAETVADKPEKIEVRRDAPELRIGPRLKAMIDGAQSEVDITSPYFVPGAEGTSFLTGLSRRGVSTKILTNSLASTDEPAAHAGYAHYRRPLLEGGVELYELRPTVGAAQPATAQGTSSGVSLHAKSVVVDRKYVFIGSLNMDQRSKLLNTEMGVLIDCPALAGAVTEFFDAAILPGSAFHVVLEPSPIGKPDSATVSWRWQDDGKPQTDQSDPAASKKRKLEVLTLRMLPLESLL